MNKLFYFLLCALVSFNLSAQHEQIKIGFLSLNKAHIFSENRNQRLPKMGWYSNYPEVQIDYHTLPNGKAALLIPSAQGRTVNAYFHTTDRIIIGKKIVFKGKYKYQQAHNAIVDFTIVLDTYDRKDVFHKKTIKCNGKQDWTEFQVEMPLERSRNFKFRISCLSAIKLWVTDCQVLVDGQSFDTMTDQMVEVDKDIKFAKSSRISVDATHPQILENLETLGKVWGFLKYYHPQITVGKYNWDFELFRVLPEIANAKNKEERNFLINKWIDHYGSIMETENHAVKDSSLYHRFAHLEWLEDTNLFDKALSDKLLKIKQAKRNGIFNYYLPILTDNEDIEFVRDKPYPEVSWKDQGYRILTLFRLWNAIEYAYPYIEYTDHKWNTLLAKYLPEFIKTSSEEDLNRSIQNVLAEINDSHGHSQLPEGSQPMSGLALGLTQTYNGELVVASTQLKEIERGSVILTVNDKPVSKIVEHFRSIIPSSNEKGLLRNVASVLFLTKDSTEKLTVKYKDKTYQKQVRTHTVTMTPKKRKGINEYDLESKGIIYIDIGLISAEKLIKLMENEVKTAKGLILDMRKYPRGYTKDIMEKFLYPRKTDYMWFSINSKKNPGNFFLDIIGRVGPETNPDHFKGKVAILVNEETQSLGEMYSIAFRAAPQSAIIGTQTAGANGHVGYLYLPRAIKVNYTAAGAFYPNWGINQRSGVKIDIPVEQTIKNVEDGEDVWVEKAIKYIEGN